MGADDLRLFDALSMSRVVIGHDEEGVAWAGNQNIILRNAGLMQPEPASVSKLLDLGETVEVMWTYETGGMPLLRQSSGSLLRVYERSDGEQVLLADDLCAVIELGLGEGDDPATLAWRQSKENTLGAVAASRSAGGPIHALIMPVRAQ